MRCLLLRILALGSVLFALPGTWAEDTPVAQELKELKQTVQQQSKQIELLAEQIGRLTRVLEAQKASELAPPATSVEKPGSEPTPEAPKAKAVPKAELASGGTKHVVASGENLTTIAKQYNISVADLKNVNKIENERKIQIGQILTIPTPKTPETPDKKENP